MENELKQISSNLESINVAAAIIALCSVIMMACGVFVISSLLFAG